MSLDRQRTAARLRLRRLPPYSQLAGVNEVRSPAIPLREPGLNLHGQDGIARHEQERSVNNSEQSTAIFSAAVRIPVTLPRVSHTCLIGHPVLCNGPGGGTGGLGGELGSADPRNGAANTCGQPRQVHWAC